MKTIGTSSQGNPIVELEPADRDLIMACSSFLASLPVMRLSEVDAIKHEIVPPKPESHQALIKKRSPAPRRGKTPLQESQQSERPPNATCAVCGKPFVKRTSNVTCSDACRDTRIRAQKLTYSKKTGNPQRQADREARGLTKEARAARLKTLLAVGTKLGIRDGESAPASSASSI